MLDTIGEARPNLQATFFCGLQHIDTLVLADQQNLCTNTGYRREDSQRMKAIGTDTKRDSIESVQLAPLWKNDDDDDNFLHVL